MVIPLAGYAILSEGRNSCLVVDKDFGFSGTEQRSTVGPTLTARPTRASTPTRPPSLCNEHEEEGGGEGEGENEIIKNGGKIV